MDFLGNMIRMNQDKHHDRHAGLAGKKPGNRSIPSVMIAAGMVLVIVVIVMFMTLVPFALSLFVYVEQNGVKGIVEAIFSVVQRFWEGSGGKGIETAIGVNR
jgi:hypothetical protein